MKNFFGYLAIFFAIGTIITVTGLTILDHFIYSVSQSSVIEPSLEKGKKDAIKAQNSKIKIEDGATSIQYSYNNKYYTYLKDSKIYINTTADGKNVDVIEEKENICYYNLLYDKNLILYFTETKNGASSKLQLKTYEINTKKKMEYNKFNVNNFSEIKDMNMSPIINIIYINVEIKGAKTTNNIIYRIDLFNSMSQVKSGLLVKQMIMLQHKDRIYYEDIKSNIYMGNTLINLFKEKVEMVGIDYDDNLYFLSSSTKNKVYKVKDNKIQKTIQLSDTDVVRTYTNNEGAYIIYPTYVINVAGEDPYKRIGKLSRFVEFQAIKGDTMYVKTADNEIAKTKIIVE
ncbi:MAG: hypothetical protein RSD14_04180 [Clostridia bacterium]